MEASEGVKFALISGSHPRHLYYANQIARHFDVAGALIEYRENMIPMPPRMLPARDHVNWMRHFYNRFNKERYYFGVPEAPTLPNVRYTTAEGLNDCADFIRDLEPDVVLIFGPGMIRPPLFDVLPEHTYNLHLGLSPRYRGAATLFWPFYFLEPAYAGVTFHRIVSEPDAGLIAHQCRPTLHESDTIHDVACKAVITATEDVIKVCNKLERTGSLDLHKQKATGKNFLARDFQPLHLRMIYDVFDDDIVRAYLDGEIERREPKMYQQVY